VSDRLAVVEEPDRFLVVREDDPSDWLCAFARDGDFPAERWAQNMVSTYNERLELSDETLRPGAVGSEQDSEFTRLEGRQREVQDQVDRFRAGDRLDRDGIHGRAAR